MNQHHGDQIDLDMTALDYLCAEYKKQHVECSREVVRATSTRCPFAPARLGPPCKRFLWRGWLAGTRARWCLMAPDGP
eukprot:COSAG01_NODE_14980_length_1389_cov_0.909302_3_plen_78_part_00